MTKIYIRLIDETGSVEKVLKDVYLEELGNLRIIKYNKAYYILSHVATNGDLVFVYSRVLAI